MLNMEFFQKVDRFLQVCPGSTDSMYRTRKRNALIGGAPNSWHLSGQAVDIIYDSVQELRQAAQTAIEFFHGVEVDLRNLHLHVDNRDTPWLTCIGQDGKQNPLHQWLDRTSFSEKI